MIPDSEIPKYPEIEVKSKIGKILKKHIPLEEYSVTIYETDSYFYKHEKKYKLIKMGVLFRIDIYFSECFLAVEIDEKGHTDRDIIFEEKKQKALEKKLSCKFIRIITSNAKNGYDLDHEIGNAFIDEFKNKKIRKTIKEKEIKVESRKWK